MKYCRSVILLAASILSGYANAGVPVIYGSPLYGRVGEAVATFSLDEIANPGAYGPMTRGGKGVAGQIIKQLPKAGNVVKYGGAFALTGAAVYGALNWFYNELQRETNTDLDDWWLPTGYPSPQRVGDFYPSGGWCNYQSVVDGKIRYNTRYLASTKPASSTASPSYVVAARFTVNGVATDPFVITGESNSSSEALSWAGTCPTNAPTIADVVGKGGSAAGDALKDIIQEYLSKHPELIPPMFNPVPNENEIADDIANPGIDTDKDGVTDGDERPDRVPTILPQPGNRPVPGDTKTSDPSDPSSKPNDTDGDGIPDWRDADDDNDGVPDDKEDDEAAQKDPKRGPTDTDKDGIPDDQDPDDDNDGVPDDKDPAPKDENVPKKCGTGYTASSDGKSCVPDKDPPKCPEGMTADTSQEPVVCVPDDKPKEPTSDDCGDFSIPRLLSHTSHYLRDVVFPCDEPGDIIKPITDALKTKFPFSLAASLNGWFKAPSGDSTGSSMPTKLGIIPLDWGWLAPLWTIIKTIVGVALWAWFIYWLIDRFTPGVNI